MPPLDKELSTHSTAYLLTPPLTNDTNQYIIPLYTFTHIDTILTPDTLLNK